MKGVKGGGVKLQTKVVLSGQFFVYLNFVCLFDAVFDLLHDDLTIFRVPYKLITASGNFFRKYEW